MYLIVLHDLQGSKVHLTFETLDGAIEAAYEMSKVLHKTFREIMVTDNTGTRMFVRYYPRYD